MELTVNYSYVAQVVPPRCRKARPQRFDDGVAVLSVREVTTEQAPIAIIGSEMDLTTGTYREPLAYRWFESRLWTDCSVYSCSGKHSNKYPALGPSLDFVSDLTTLVDHDLGIYISAHAGKQGVADHLEAAANDWLIIDGQLHRTAGEPMYVVMTFGLGCNHGGTALMTADHLNPNIRVEAYYSLLELPQAVERTQKVATERGDTVKVSTDPGFQFEVLIPEAIQWANPALRGDDTADAA